MRKFFYIILIAMILPSLIQAQSVSDLENQRKQALKELETMNKMLNETKKSQRSSLNKLSILNKNIQERKKLIERIGTEISKLDSEVNRLSRERRTLNNRLTTLKKDYARMIQEAHINRSVYSKIMFILSAETFDQSYRRMRYLQEYANFRKIQVAQIQKTTEELNKKTEELNKTRLTKTEVVKSKQTETQKLTDDQKKENVVLSDLKKKEKKLQADVKVQQRKANELNNKIQRLIAEEIRKAEEAQKKKVQKKTATETKSTKPATTSKSTTAATSTLTKEEALISGNFAGNSGRLPWPTDRGFISGHYGVQPHPVLKHVTTNNKGIYIQTPSGTNARAVFEGEVTQRFSIPGSNNAVIVKHGDYRTVYANLTSIYVNVGDKVSAKQSIGKIYTDDENDNKTELYFQIWKGKQLLNPESWIAK